MLKLYNFYSFIGKFLFNILTAKKTCGILIIGDLIMFDNNVKLGFVRKK